MLLILGHFVFGLKMLTPKLIDLKTARNAGLCKEKGELLMKKEDLLLFFLFVREK